MNRIIKPGEILKATASPREKIKNLETRFIALGQVLVGYGTLVKEQEAQITELFERVVKLESQNCKGHLTKEEDGKEN